MAAKSKPQSVKMPELWRDDFRRATFRSNFNLSLSQSMIEYLCATADGVRWDRGMYGPDIHKPDNWIATQEALVKRGLIVRKTAEESISIVSAEANNIPFSELAHYKLTPAGEALVQLFKVTGVFVEADAAINKRNRKA